MDKQYGLCTQHEHIMNIGRVVTIKKFTPNPPNCQGVDHYILEDSFCDEVIGEGIKIISKEEFEFCTMLNVEREKKIKEMEKEPGFILGGCEPKKTTLFPDNWYKNFVENLAKES